MQEMEAAVGKGRKGGFQTLWDHLTYLPGLSTELWSRGESPSDGVTKPQEEQRSQRQGSQIHRDSSS